MPTVASVLVAVVLTAAAVGVWYAWRAWLQLCPHCGWIVRRVHRGWLRCARCHKQYGKHARLRPH